MPKGARGGGGGGGDALPLVVVAPRRRCRSATTSAAADDQGVEPGVPRLARPGDDGGDDLAQLRGLPVGGGLRGAVFVLAVAAAEPAGLLLLGIGVFVARAGGCVPLGVLLLLPRLALRLFREPLGRAVGIDGRRALLLMRQEGRRRGEAAGAGREELAERDVFGEEGLLFFWFCFFEFFFSSREPPSRERESEKKKQMACSISKKKAFSALTCGSSSSSESL